LCLEERTLNGLHDKIVFNMILEMNHTLNYDLSILYENPHCVFFTYFKYKGDDAKWLQIDESNEGKIGMYSPSQVLSVIEPVKVLYAFVALFSVLAFRYYAGTIEAMVNDVKV